MMENKETTKETRDYIKERFRSAVDLLKNIEHRKQTIYRVCERIVERQRDFLDHGVEHIKPMMLKDISEDLGMHLSTVSRVVNGKYAHTPQGVIELRRFFTEGMVNDDGEEVSTRIIKFKIKKMIEAEDPRHPLTDDRDRNEPGGRRPETLPTHGSQVPRPDENPGLARTAASRLISSLNDRLQSNLPTIGSHSVRIQEGAER